MLCGFVVGLVETTLIEVRQPCRQGRRNIPGGLHLPQRDTNDGAAVAIRGELGRRLPGVDGVLHALLDRNGLGVAESGHHLLECVQMSDLERTGLAEPVARGMRGVKMRAGNPSRRNRFGRRMGAAALQEFWQHMGMRPVRALAGGRRDRLIHLDAAEPGEEDAVRIARAG